MSTIPKHRAALRAAILMSILTGVVLLYGCSTPAAQMATTQATAMPTPTAMGTPAGAPTAAPVTDEQLATLGCVCHAQNEHGAPPVSQVASLPASTITTTVREGRGVMPAWSTESLSDQLLARVINGLMSAAQATPGTATTPTP